MKFTSHLPFPYWKVTFMWLLGLHVLPAQNFNVLETEIAYHADVMNNAQKAAHRVLAFEKFYPAFKEVLAMEGSFNFPFDSLVWISKKEPLDKSFRIFTGILDQGAGNFKHFGLIQDADGSVTELKDVLRQADDWEFSVGDKNTWMGAMYYQILEDESEGKKHYLLFGFHRFDASENIKILDVLEKSESGEWIFGKEIFAREKESGRPQIKTRVVLKFDQNSYVGLHFNPGMNAIVHDHLIPRKAVGLETTLSLVSDGSLVGYEKKGKYWTYIDKIFTQVLEEAPRPKPILDQEEKDIFGKPKKSGKQKDNKK